MEIFPHKHCLLQLPRFPLCICIMANPLLKDIWVAFNLLLLQRMLKRITLHIHHFVWAHICICRIKLQGLNCCDKVCICSFDKMLSIQNQFALPPAMYENAYSLTALATVCYQIWQFLPIWYLSIMLIYISLIICKVEPYLPICIRDIFISFSVNCLFTFFAHLFFFLFFEFWMLFFSFSRNSFHTGEIRPSPLFCDMSCSYFSPGYHLLSVCSYGLCFVLPIRSVHFVCF